MPIFRNNSNLVEEFSEEVLARGADYHRRGAVEFLGVRKHEDFVRFFFSVEGSETYRSLIEANSEESRVSLSCDCPHFDDGFFCKHLWASILLGDQRRIFQEQLGMDSRFTRFVHTHIEANEEFETLENPLGLDPLGEDTEAGPRVVRGPSGDSWDLVQHQELTQAAQRVQKNREAAFVVEMDSNRLDEEIVLLVLAREETKKGWGVLRPYSFQVSQLDSFRDPLDREVLQALFGSASTVDPWGRNSRTAASRISLTPQVAAHWLKEIAGAQKLFRLKKEVYGLYDYEQATVPYPFLGPQKFRLLLERSGSGFQLRMAEAFQRPKDRVLGPIVLRDEGFLLLETPQAEKWLKAFLQRKELQVSGPSLERFLDFFLSHTPEVDLVLPPELRIEERQDVLPMGQIVLQTKGSSFFQMRFQVEYAGQSVNLQDSREQIFHRATRTQIRRHRMHELELQNNYLDIRGGQDFFPSEKLTEMILRSTERKFSVFFEGQKLRTSGSLSLSLQRKSGIDWLDLHGTARFGQLAVSLPELLASVRAGSTLVPLASGELGVLDPQLVERLSLLAQFLPKNSAATQLNRVQALFLSSFLGQEIEQADSGSLFPMMEELKKVGGVAAGAKFLGDLRDYQTEGLGWLKVLQKHSVGGILADDMGLGKTIQILALLSSQKFKNPAFIVAPKSLMFNWASEIEKFVPHLKVLILTGSQRHGSYEQIAKHDVVLTTYQTLRQDIEKLKEMEFDYLILDEAHHIKNSQAQASVAARMVRAQQRFALTGTPIENSLADLFSILSILNPGLFPERMQKFWVRKAPDELGSLANALRPFLLRRTKEQVLSELPAKTEQTLFCELSSSERKHYDELKTYYWSHLSSKFNEKGFAKTKIEILEALLRLRQASCHLGLLDHRRGDTRSSKFEVLIASLQELIEEGHRALVFSQFTSLLSLLRQELDALGIRYEYLDGQTNDRQERVQRFQENSDIPLFLLSIKAGGVGLNLTGADYVFILDPWWNPAVEAQAIDRTHRIGQTKKVFAYKIVAKDTIEEKILELQKRKKQIADAVIANDSSLLKSMKLEDLQALFS